MGNSYNQKRRLSQSPLFCLKSTCSISIFEENLCYLMLHCLYCHRRRYFHREVLSPEIRRHIIRFFSHMGSRVETLEFVTPVSDSETNCLDKFPSIMLFSELIDSIYSTHAISSPSGLMPAAASFLRMYSMRAAIS